MSAQHSSTGQLSRRDFLGRSSQAVAGGVVLAQAPFVAKGHPAALTKVKIGVIGCGGRGSGAVLDALGAATHVIYPQAGYHTEDVAAGAAVAKKDIEVVALSDVFPDRLKRCRVQLGKLGIEVPASMCFAGFDGFKKLLEIEDINYVIHATPPHFRPMHAKAVIEAGKHLFMEKPGAVDGPGVRVLLEAYELAKKKGLGIACGTQRRHQKSYVDTVARIHEGAIGEIQSLSCFWNGGVIWVIERTPEMSDMEWQLRNWNYFTWVGGDHYVEQHVHNLDVMNWVMRAHPVRAYGMGGRQGREAPIHGHIYDHFAVMYEYANGVRMFSQARQMHRCEGKVDEQVVGRDGVSNCSTWLKQRDGKMWRYREASPNPYQQEHEDLITSIRMGQPINEAKDLAESTLTAIMGREAAYTGHTVEWEQALNSQMRLGPEKYEFCNLPFPKVPMPGDYILS